MTLVSAASVVDESRLPKDLMSRLRRDLVARFGREEVASQKIEVSGAQELIFLDDEGISSGLGSGTLANGKQVYKFLRYFIFLNGECVGTIDARKVNGTIEFLGSRLGEGPKEWIGLLERAEKLSGRKKYQVSLLSSEGLGFRTLWLRPAAPKKVLGGQEDKFLVSESEEVSIHTKGFLTRKEFDSLLQKKTRFQRFSDRSVGRIGNLRPVSDLIAEETMKTSRQESDLGAGGSQRKIP